MNTANSSLDISVEAPGGLERRVTVRVPQADIDREVDERLDKVRRTARLKGFRPGKVPAKVVRKHYGGQVRQEVLSDVIQSSYSRAVEQEQLNPAGGPRIEPLEAGDGEHFTYCAVFEVFPEIELKPLAEAGIERPTTEIAEPDIDRMIEKLREQRAHWHAVERPAAQGDRVTIDFVGRIDGEEFEGGKGENVAIIIGDGQVIADFDQALVGLAAGDKKSAEVNFPADYQADTLAGKLAVFDIEAHAVEQKHLPELDDAFAEEFSVAEGGIDGLRGEVKNNMQREVDERLKARVKQQVFDALIAANDIPLPQALVDDETRSLQESTAQRLGIKDPAQLPPAERFHATARRRVAAGLLLRELITAHEIKLDQARVQTRIEELAAPYERPAEAAQLYRGSRELMAQIEGGVLEDQAVEYVLEHANVTDKVLAFDELMQE